MASYSSQFALSSLRATVQALWFWAGVSYRKCLVSKLGSGVSLPSQRIQLCHFLVVQLWASY